MHPRSFPPNPTPPPPPPPPPTLPANHPLQRAKQSSPTERSKKNRELTLRGVCLAWLIGESPVKMKALNLCAIGHLPSFCLVDSKSDSTNKLKFEGSRLMGPLDENMTLFHIPTVLSSSLLHPAQAMPIGHRAST